MRVFNLIMGLFGIFASVYCFAWPREDVWTNCGIIIAYMLILWGVCNILAFIFAKKEKVVHKKTVIRGTTSIIFGLVAAYVVVGYLANPSSDEVGELIVYILFAIWLVVDGTINSVVAAELRKAFPESKSWLVPLIIGIVELVVVILAVIDGFTFNQFAIPLTGIMLAVFGASLIVSTFTYDPTAVLE